MRWAAGLMYAPRGDEEAGGGTARATHCGGGTGGGAPARPRFGDALRALVCELDVDVRRSEKRRVLRW